MMVMMMGGFDYESLDDGVREAVRVLRTAGFNTTDSGDGSKFGSMDGALGFKHVFIVLEPGYEGVMTAGADRVVSVLDDAGMSGAVVEATWSTEDRLPVLMVRWGDGGDAGEASSKDERDPPIRAEIKAWLGFATIDVWEHGEKTLSSWLDVGGIPDVHASYRCALRDAGLRDERRMHGRDLSVEITDGALLAHARKLDIGDDEDPSRCDFRNAKAGPDDPWEKKKEKVRRIVGWLLDEDDACVDQDDVVSKSEIVKRLAGRAMVDYLPVVRPVSCVPRAQVLDKGCEPGPGDGGCDDWVDVRGWYGQVPIADVGPFPELAKGVAERLAKTPTSCTSCGTAVFGRGLITSKHTTGNNCPGQWVDDPTCHGGGFLVGQPFAAAWSTIGAGREFTIAAGICKRCLGHRNAGQGPAYGPCDACGGTGARVDLAAIVKTYGGTVDEGNSRIARFHVSL